MRGFFIQSNYTRKDIVIENKTKVNLKVDKGAVKMCGILEKGKNLRRFLFGVVVVVFVVAPIAWQIKDILNV